MTWEHPNLHSNKKAPSPQANNEWKIRKRKSYANKTQGYEMTINDNKEDLRQVVFYHISTSDKSALAMMCGRDEEPWPSVEACWKIVMVCTCCKAMDTCCQ